MKVNPVAVMEERRAMLSRIGKEMRATEGESLRSLTKEQQSALDLVRQCRATCYGAAEYICRMPYDAFPDGIFGALYQCITCCETCGYLACIESPLVGTAHELCAEGCRQCATVCAEADDPILVACVTSCSRTADACEAMAAPGEAEEENSAPNSAEKRAAFTCPNCGYEGDSDEQNSAPIVGEVTRSFKSEIRSTSDGRKVIGYPIRFNELSQDLGGFRERILPGAVQFADDVRADFNHNPDYILGRRNAGTLTLSEDASGVRMEADAPETTWADDLLVSIRRGDIDQGSFAFRVLPGGQQVSEENGQQVRTLSKIVVRRVSVVSDPAYTGTSVQVRNNPGHTSNTASQEAPPAYRGGVDMLRRRLDLMEQDIN